MSEHGTPQQGSFEISNGDFRVPEAPQPDERSHPQKVMDQARAEQEHIDAIAAAGDARNKLKEIDPNARRVEQLAKSGGGLAAAAAGDLPTQNQPTEPRVAPLRRTGRRAHPSVLSDVNRDAEADTQALLKVRREGGDPQGVANAVELREVLAHSTQPEPPEAPAARTDGRWDEVRARINGSPDKGTDIVTRTDVDLEKQADAIHELMQSPKPRNLDEPPLPDSNIVEGDWPTPPDPSRQIRTRGDQYTFVQPPTPVPRKPEDRPRGDESGIPQNVRKEQWKIHKTLDKK